MNSSKKLNFLHVSALTRLKEKWRTLRKSEQDYWRAQFNSSRTLKSIRGEMATRLGVMLIHDLQLTHFRRWLVSEHEREIEAMMMRADLAPRAPDFKNPGAATSMATMDWLYRQYLKDLQRQALHALLQPEDQRWFRKYAQRKLDQFHHEALCLWVLAWANQPLSLNSRN